MSKSVSELISLNRQAVQEGNRVQALEFLKQAQALEPKNLNIAIEAASHLRELARFEEAIELLNQWLPEHASAVGLQMALALIARKQGQRELALQYFIEAHQLDIHHRTLPNDIAVELRDLARYQEALDYLQRYEDSLMPELLVFQRGQIYLRQGSHEQAMKTFQLGIESYPQDIRFYQALLAFYQQYGLYDDALILIEEAQEKMGFQLIFSLGKVRCKMGQGYYEEAQHLCQEALQHFPKEFAFWHHYIDLCIRTGQFDEAQQAIEQAQLHQQLHHIEQQQYIFRWLSELAKAKFQLDVAVDYAKQGLDLNPQNMGLRNHLALLELMSGSTQYMSEILMQLKAKAAPGRRVWPSALGNIQGRLYGEMRTNPFVERRLGVIGFSVEPTQRIQELAAILKDEPNGIAAALQLLITLRAHGYFNEIELVQANKTLELAQIPRTIMQFWDASQIPGDVQRTLDSWVTAHPEFQHQVFDDAKALAFLEQYFDPSIARAFRMSNHAAMRADVFRLAYLYSMGGIYADADDACRAPVTSWLKPGLELLLLQEHLGSVGNNFIAVIPRHPWIKQALDRVVANILQQQGDIWFSSGPGALTLSFCEYYLDLLGQCRLPPGVQLITCFEAEQKLSIRLPRQYKQTEKSWSAPQNRHIPIYRPVFDSRANTSRGGSDQ